MRQVKTHAARRRTFADNNIQRKVLHRRIEDFLYRFREAVDFINKQNVILAKIRQYRCQISLTLNRRTTRHADIHVQLVGNNIRQRRFAEARRAEEQHMVERLMTGSSSLDEDRQIILDLLLADIFI